MKAKSVTSSNDLCEFDLADFFIHHVLDLLEVLYLPASLQVKLKDASTPFSANPSRSARSTLKVLEEQLSHCILGSWHTTRVSLLISFRIVRIRFESKAYNSTDSPATSDAILRHSTCSSLTSERRKTLIESVCQPAVFLPLFERSSPVAVVQRTLIVRPAAQRSCSLRSSHTHWVWHALTVILHLASCVFSFDSSCNLLRLSWSSLRS